jgi:hypothetical protein
LLSKWGRHDGKLLAGRTQLQISAGEFIIKTERFAMSEQDIQQLENEFPALSGTAFASAREHVLESGQSVLQSEDGVIYQVFPDGHKKAVKKIEPPTQVVSGSIFTIR